MLAASVLEFMIKTTSGIDRGYVPTDRQPPSSSETKLLEKVVIDPETGYMFDENGKLHLFANQWGWPDALVRRPYPIAPKAALFREGKFKYLPSSSFYHWLMEDLPSFLKAHREAPDAITIVPTNRSKYLSDFVGLMGDSQFMFTKVPIGVKNLILGAKDNAVSPTRSAILELQSFANRVSLPQIGFPKRVFATRKPAKDRTPSNLEEIEVLLSDLGFEILYLESLSLQEQIVLFQHAEFVVGLHGAGLANLSWSKKLNGVLEIKKSAQPNCFQDISEYVGAKYSSIASPASSRWEVDCNSLKSQLEVLL